MYPAFSTRLYLEFMNSRNKPKLRTAHDSEIRLYEVATKELKRILGDKPIPSEKKTWALIQELSSRKNEEYEELSEIRHREKSLQEKVNNVRRIYAPDRKQAKKKKHELG